MSVLQSVLYHVCFTTHEHLDTDLSEAGDAVHQGRGCTTRLPVAPCVCVCVGKVSRGPEVLRVNGWSPVPPADSRLITRETHRQVGGGWRRGERDKSVTEGRERERARGGERERERERGREGGREREREWSGEKEGEWGDSSHTVTFSSLSLSIYQDPITSEHHWEAATWTRHLNTSLHLNRHVTAQTLGF